jgi:hypothetical protein
MGEKDKTQTTIDSGNPKGPEPKGGDAIDALRSEMRGEFRQALEAERESFRQQLNEEREMNHAAMDAMRADRDDAVQRLRTLKPADFGSTTLLVDKPQTPQQRRAARPLPRDGIFEIELTHGSFLGETVEETFNHEKPARPGDVLKFDMSKAAHQKSAKNLIETGCADR